MRRDAYALEYVPKVISAIMDQATVFINHFSTRLDEVIENICFIEHLMNFKTKTYNCIVIVLEKKGLMSVSVREHTTELKSCSTQHTLLGTFLFCWLEDLKLAGKFINSIANLPW